MDCAFRIICFLACFYQVHACARRNRRFGNVWQRYVGNNLLHGPYQGVDHPVTRGEELACTFDSGPCCWSNAQDDQLDYELLGGSPMRRRMRRAFRSRKYLPSGQWLGVGTETGIKKLPKTAQFYSCPIQCANSPIIVGFKHWNTRDTTIKVCEEDTPGGPLQNCQLLKGKAKKNGASREVALPPGVNKRLVIVAEGFTNLRGSVAMLDDIYVQFTPCAADTVTQGAVPAVPSCTQLSCNFEAGNPCSYTPAQQAGGTKQWEVVNVPYKNPLTGVPTTAGGQYLAGTYLAPGETAVMSTDASFPANYIVQFAGYRATEGIDLMACCGEASSCPFSTTNFVQVADYRNWRKGTISCPAGTNKVIFKAVNSGKNYGAAGLDDIHLLAPGGGALC